MQQFSYKLLKGTLEWEGNTGDSFSIQVVNKFPFALNLAYVPNPGSSAPTSSFLVAANDNVTISSTPGDLEPTGYYKVTVAATGALVTVFECYAGAASVVTIDSASLPPPNDIGPIPVPTAQLPVPVEPQSSPAVTDSTMVIPPNSPRVLAAYGTATNGNIVIREQYWERQNDSLCLAGHETRTVSYTVNSGKQETSSNEDTVSGSLGFSSSAGWGPISASLSGSLSKNSTSFQQVTVTEQTTSYVSNTIHNPEVEPVAYLRWQLIDVITVLDKASGNPASSLIQAANPTIVMGPYWVAPLQRMIPPGGAGTKGADATIEVIVRGPGLFEYK